MENQRNLVELTKSRLIGLHGVKKLGKIAMETIIRGINPNGTMGPTNHLKAYLRSPDLCDKIFQHLLVKLGQIPEENQREYLEKIDFLLTEETKFLDLSDVLPKRILNTMKNDYGIAVDELELVQSVINKVLNQAPSIEYIVFNNIRLFRNYDNHMEFLDGLTNFKQLKIIEMILVDLGTTQVLNLCKNLPQLQILEINSFDERYSDVESEEKIRQSLGNLRLLVGHTDERRRREIQQQFPHLNLASYLQNTVDLSTLFRPVKHEDFLEDEIRTPPQRKYFSCGEDWFDGPNMDIHLKHPDVTYLEINFQFAKEIPHTTPELPKFSKIGTLIARKCTNGTIITDILRIYGQGLRTLWLESSDQQSFELKRFLELCPKLETIQLNRIVFTDNSTQKVDLPRLRELYLIHNSYESLLPIIKSSPRLQKFEIFGRFVKEDLEELNTMVSESQILQELESIKIIAVSHPRDAFRKLLDFLENASAFLPKLKDMQFVYNGQDYVGLANRYKRDHGVAPRNQITDIIVNNKTLVPILESFSKLRT